MAKAATRVSCLENRRHVSPRSDCIQTVGLRGSGLDIIMHGTRESGLVRASQWLRIEHAADAGSQLAGPGCLIEPKHNNRRTRHVSLWPD